MNKIYRLQPQALALADDATKAPDRIQIIRTGTFHHPTYGKFEITKAHLASFKKNFDSKVRGVDIALDYGHKSEGEAAAWFKNVELSDDGTQLWGEPTWTPDGAAAVVGKKYRYVSADFNFDYEDNETLKKHGPTLLGAGLTNRPVVKNQAPVIELTEGKGIPMAVDEQKFADLEKKVDDIATQVAEIAKSVKPADKPLDEKATETEKQLSEATAKIQMFEKEKADSEKKSAFDKMLSEGKAVEAQREPYMKDDVKSFMEKAQPVNLKNRGTGGGGTGDKKTATEEVMELADKKIADKKAKTKTEAYSMVLAEEPELAKRFQQER